MSFFNLVSFSVLLFFSNSEMDWNFVKYIFGIYWNNYMLFLLPIKIMNDERPDW